MPSLRAHLFVALLRLIRRKRIYTSVAGVHAGIARVRAKGPSRPGAAVKRRVTVSVSTLHGHDVYRLSPKGHQRGPNQPHLLYLHGGAYIRPITAFHWRMLAELVERTGCTATVPLYPLAPEHCCEDTVNFVLQVHAQLLQADQPRRLTVAGDSAGGGLALALSLALRDQGLPQPEHLVLITPSVDAALDHPQILATEARDPMLGIVGAQEAARLYARSWPTSHPYVSPLQAVPHGMPPITMLVATRDILCHDALRFAQQVAAQGGRVKVHLGEEMIHVWPLLPIPEGQSARQLLVRAIQEGFTSD